MTLGVLRNPQGFRKSDTQTHRECDLLIHHQTVISSSQQKPLVEPYKDTSAAVSPPPCNSWPTHNNNNVLMTLIRGDTYHYHLLITFWAMGRQLGNIQIQEPGEEVPLKQSLWLLMLPYSASINYLYFFFLRSPAISQEAKYRLLVELFLMTNMAFIYGKTVSFGLMA